MLNDGQRQILQSLFGPPQEPHYFWGQLLGGGAAAVDLPPGSHSLLPLLLQRYGAPAGPVGHQFRTVVRQQRLICLWLVGQFHRLSGGLKAGGIDVIVLKGLGEALAHPDQPSRAFGDLDLLVPPEQMAAAAAVLEASGIHRLRAVSLYPYDPVRHAVEFRAADGRLNVDLHRRPNHLVPLSFERLNTLWSDAKPIACGRSSVLLPCLEDRIAIACAHALFYPNRVSGDSFRYLVDLLQLLRGPVVPDPARLEWALRLDTPALESLALIDWCRRVEGGRLPPEQPWKPVDSGANMRRFFHGLRIRNLRRASWAITRHPIHSASLLLRPLTLSEPSNWKSR